MSENEKNTLDRILDIAKKEFLQKGYQGVGLREIVRKAGVTTGAFYGYFKTKEELFSALVKEHYDKIISMYKEVLGNFQKLPPEEQQIKMQEYTLKAADMMVDYMYENYDAFKLILCHSDGTPYNNLVNHMATMEVQSTHDFTKTTGELGIEVNDVNPMVEHILTSGMFSMFFELIIHDIEKEKAKPILRQLLDFYYGGWMKLMGLDCEHKKE